MTAKQAIKARCRDCLAGGRVCAFTDCALKGLGRPKRGANRTAAIRRYCQWCMNGHQVSLCASPDCAIYQYRAGHKGYLKIDFKPLNHRNICTAGDSKPKDVKTYGTGETSSGRNGSDPIQYPEFAHRQGVQRGVKRPPNQKAIETHGKGGEALQNAVLEPREGGGRKPREPKK